MRTIIAGSRDITDQSVVDSAILESGFSVTSVVCGEARGVDLLGKRWANKQKVPVMSFPAQWNLHGRSAGFVRNTEMAENADALIAIWDGSSRGTKMMIDIAKKKGLVVFVKTVSHNIQEQNEEEG